jgi:hypothetical protein
MSRQTIRLDPAAPYLADHQPGGRPLLGTVASLEILAEAASPLMGGIPRRIEAVDIVAPLILASGAFRTARIECRAMVGGIAVCSLESGVGASAARHLSCRFLSRAPDYSPRRQPMALGPHAVDRDEIYSLFFHGPTFQVVAAAEWRDGVLLARLNAPLPPWHIDGRPALMAPRLIEFALQSAGLLAMGDQPAMAIPRHIARIEYFLPSDERSLPELFAAATPGEAGIDIDLFDLEGRVHMRIAGYRTTALPYPIAQDRMDALHRALRR